MTTTTDIAYVATHGFAARMIMQTDLLGKLVESGCSVALITPDRNDPVLKAYCDGRGIAHYDFLPPNSRKKSEFFRLRKYLLDDIKANPTLWERHILDTKYASRRRPWRQIRPRLYLLAYHLRKVFPGIRDWYWKQERKFLEVESARELLREIDPKVFVATYPVNFGEGMLQSAARHHGSKTVIHLLSWDNISSKGTFSEMADHYLLWGEEMRSELETYYGVTGDNVYLTGVPHFDLHVANRQQPRPGPFLEKMGLDPDRPYLFFGMSSAHFAPREIDIVEWLADQVRAGTFGDELQLVVRPHPQNMTGFLAEPAWLPRLEALVGNRVSVDFPSLVQSKMAWSMAAHDMDRLSNLIAGSSLVYNTGSTISIDALMCDVPVILTSFDGNDEIEYWKSARRLLDYEHLRKLSVTGALSVSRSFAQLAELTRQYLENKDHLQKPRRTTVRNYCANYDEGRATERVRDVLITILNSGKSPN